jgi:hypothetical protein
VPSPLRAIHHRRHASNRAADRTPSRF